MSEADQKIRVIVRKRPVNSRELHSGDPDILYQRSASTIVVKEEKVKVDLTKYIEEHHFTYDRVFTESTSNEQLYAECVKPLVSAAYQGAKVSCFAYGQTGSGKTYTMMGESSTPGLYVLAAHDLFAQLRSNQQIFVSFFEIYCGKLHDLLNSRNLLHAREDSRQNVNIVGLQRQQVSTVQELMSAITYGLAERTTGQTGANDNSSRSHAVLEIVLRENRRTCGKMSFIDLAGSERGADVNNSDRQTRMDSAEINKSLLALKECIRALDQVKRHTPFRGSKLTQVLKDSFVGNCRTVMIANVSPGLSSCEHTLNTLRYSDRVKELGKIDGKSENNNIMMLPRQESNVIRYTGLQQNKSNDMVKLRNSPPKKKPTLEEMPKDHENLIQVILAEEEELITSHRKLIDGMVELVKHQMEILAHVDKPGSDIDSYVGSLSRLLDQKVKMIQNLQGKLNKFNEDLRTEERLSKKFYALQNNAGD